MFFFSASFFNASYKADGILIFNALSFTFSPPLQFYYKYCCMSSASSTNFLFYFCWFCSPCQKRPSPTVTKKCKKTRKTGKWRSVTLICILYAREKKSKNFLYIEGMEMTVTDCHHEKTAVQKMEHAKNFRFLGKVCKRPTSSLFSLRGGKENFSYEKRKFFSLAIILWNRKSTIYNW